MILLSGSVGAQVPNGTLAPDFNVTDVNGVQRHLYDVLDSGKVVILEISATWCPPCWSYHQGGALQNFYEEHGPAGDNQARVFWVEGDANTNLACIFGQSGCNDYSPGNYAAGVTYPLINNANLSNLYQITYFPSIFIICPNRKVYQGDPVPADLLWEKAQVCPIAYGENNAGIFEYDPGYDLPEICGAQNLTPTFELTNLGSSPLTAANILLKWNGNTVQTINWEGHLNTYSDTLLQFGPLVVSEPGTLNTVITSINNNTVDDDFSDNFKNTFYTDAQGFNDSRVLLKIRTDGYGEEIYWELKDDLGNVLDRGGNQFVGPNGGGKFPLGVGPGPGAYPKNALIKDTLYLPANGCYSIHFVDGYGDGMCCQYGNGYFRLHNLDNPVTPIISGGEFEAYDRHAFSVDDLSVATAQPELFEQVQLFPNPANDLITVDLGTVNYDQLEWQLFDGMGQALAENRSESDLFQIETSNLPAGIYFLKLEIRQASTQQIGWRKFTITH